jgi:hypothetical protein
MKRALADRADEGVDRGVVKLLGLNAFPACVAREPRQSDAMPRFRKLRQQLGPTQAQGRSADLLRWLKLAGVDGRQEIGTDIAEGLWRKPISATYGAGRRRSFRRKKAFIDGTRRLSEMLSCRFRNSLRRMAV